MNNGADSESYNTKEFSNCGSNTIEIELEDVLNFVIRGRKVNENSNYTINVYQRQVKPDGLLLIILFSIVLVMILITVLVLIIICWCGKKNQQPDILTPNINAPNVQNDSELRNELILKCLNNMRKDEFKNTRAKFNQNNCIICIKDYEPDSEVCITNEWNHVFHATCIKGWFENIRFNKDLTWPICNTVITDSSETHKNDLKYEPEEVSASLEFGTPDQKLHKNQNVLANYI